MAFPASPSASTIPIVIAANTADYRTLPNCMDAGGNHLNYDSPSQTFSCGTSSAGSGTALTRPHTKRWSYIAASGTGSFTVVGDSNGSNGTCTANIAPTATEPAFTNCIQSAATINTNAGVSGSNPIWRVGRNISMQYAGKVRENTSVRAWIGLTDQTTPTMLGSDNPAGNHAAFRFSTSAADATVKCITKDGATQNIQTATGIADLTVFREYEITEDVAAGKWRFYIDGAEVCGSGLSANLPTSGTNLRYVAAQQNLTTAQRNTDTAWVQITADK